MNKLSEKYFCKLSDEELMLHYGNGASAAFDELYARHKGGLYRYILRQLNNQPEVADELFQDVWMKLINARASYQVKAKFTTWLYRLAHNRLIDFWRSGKYISQVLEFSETDETQSHEYSSHTHSSVEPQQVFQQQQTRMTVKQAVAQLPEEQRSAILLKEDGALSLAEIAEVTGVNRETVKSRLRYGMKRLQGVLHPLRAVL